MKKLLLLSAVFLSSLITAQETEDNKFAIPDYLKSLSPYASFEYVLAGGKNGWSVTNIVPRAGAKGEWIMDDNDKYKIFMAAEVGLDLLSRNDFVEITIDPGGSYGVTHTAVYARLGFIGIETPYGKLSIGKQWSVNYHLAGNIDNMYMFGADATGVYNAGTDGGPSGTGRADHSVKYEHKLGNLWIGLQSQFRLHSTNDAYFSDGMGVAAMYDFKIFKFGASFNKVFDGVANPAHGEPMIDDQLISALVVTETENMHVALIGIAFNNHEIDEIGNYYNGWGLEYNFKYNFGKKKQWSFVSNSYLKIPYESEASVYYSNRYSFEIARRFSQNTLIMTGFRYDNSTASTGEKIGLHHFAIGFYYNFNMPMW